MFKTNKGIFNANKKELMQVNLINEKLADEILNQETRKKIKYYTKYMEQNNIDIICISDKEYPSDLRQIYSPPINIYTIGNKNVLNCINVAMVGCREYSNYGKQMAENIAYNLSKNKINIVSGLAKGIDSFSHFGAIYAKGITTAVLANGLDTIYPKENIYLAKKILDSNGLIISEYPLGTKPDKLNFPARNRIISGISKGIIVVEAKKKSGTLITVDFALDQGREVFVVPRKYKFTKFRRNK